MHEEAELRRQLDDIERHIFRVTELLRRLEGERDKLILKLTDAEGAASSRFAGCR